MGQIDQAVYCSARSDCSVGYHVMAASSGVNRSDLKELAVWGPSHDSLLQVGPDAESFNFFPLPSGVFCISKTSLAGWEYSGRGGGNVYTHCLIAPPDTLLQYANHPVALARAASANGVFDVPLEAPSTLKPLDFTGGDCRNFRGNRGEAVVGEKGTVPFTICHRESLKRLVEHVGAWNIALLVQTVLNNNDCIAVSSRAPMQALIAGLFDCLPIPARTVVSFTTGLRYSSRRPFHVIPLPDNPAERRRLAHHPNMTLLDLSALNPADNLLTDAWAQHIERMLSESQFDQLADELSTPQTEPARG
jgi:hypothetical protein